MKIGKLTKDMKEKQDELVKNSSTHSFEFMHNFNSMSNNLDMLKGLTLEQLDQELRAEMDEDTFRNFSMQLQEVRQTKQLQLKGKHRNMKKNIQAN
jgi:hypothetical protein